MKMNGPIRGTFFPRNPHKTKIGESIVNLLWFGVWKTANGFMVAKLGAKGPDHVYFKRPIFWVDKDFIRLGRSELRFRNPYGLSKVRASVGRFHFGRI